MPITPFSTTPLSTDPDTFSARMDIRIVEQQRFITEANATAAAMNLNSTTDTSVTSVLIGFGAKTFTVSAGKSFQPGMYLVIADTAAPSTNSMFGQITSYSGTTLVMNILSNRGSGTLAAWVISQSSAGGGSSGGVTGGGSDLVFIENDQTVTTSYALTNNKNAMTAGPITIGNGVVVTIGTGQTWTIV